MAMPPPPPPRRRSRSRKRAGQLPNPGEGDAAAGQPAAPAGQPAAPAASGAASPINWVAPPSGSQPILTINGIPVTRGIMPDGTYMYTEAQRQYHKKDVTYMYTSLANETQEHPSGQTGRGRGAFGQMQSPVSAATPDLAAPDQAAQAADGANLPWGDARWASGRDRSWWDSSPEWSNGDWQSDASWWH